MVASITGPDFGVQASAKVEQIQYKLFFECMIDVIVITTLALFVRLQSLSALTCHAQR
jgi:hypothetical protein